MTLISTDADRVAFGMRSVSACIKKAGYTLREAQILIALRRQEYNKLRPHNSLTYRRPAPEAWLH